MDSYNKSKKSSDSSSEEKKSMSGSARYLEMLEREQAKKEAFEKLEARQNNEPVPEPEPEEIEEVEELPEEETELKEERKKTYSSLATGAAPAASSADMGVEEDLFRKIKLRNVITCTVLGVIALIMQMLNFRLPLMPTMMRLDMSTIPELVAAIGFGPVAGIIIIIVKNILYMLVMHFFGGAVTASVVANILLDSIFVTVSSLLYARGMWSGNAVKRHMALQEENPGRLRGLQAKTIMKCGLIGALVTTPISYFITVYIVYPLVFRKYTLAGYTQELYVEKYNTALQSLNGYLPFKPIVTEITSIAKGVLVYNVPITFVKLIFVTVFVAIIFKPLSKILFYRPPVDNEPLERIEREG